MINRRDALKRIGGLAGAAAATRFLSACRSDGDDGPVGITTYVYVMLENRTYDHVFGARSMLEGKPGNGLTADMNNPDVNGTPIAPFEPTSMASQLCVVADPPHSWNASGNQWNGGANDGFVKAQQADYPGNIDVMQYQTRKEQPVSWALADAYTTCDRWHAAIMGPTLPNRFFWHAATSCGYRSNEVLEDVTKLSVPTIYHRLRDAGVEWSYYYSSLPVVAALGNFRAPYDLSSDYLGPRIKRFGDAGTLEGQFFMDAAEGKLAPVNYIDPFFYLNDDHPPSHPLMAQQFIAAIYTALAKSPQWKNCMLVITYDEHGGFFDHVSPGKTADDTAQMFPTDEDGNPTSEYTDGTGKVIHGFDQLGFRVPAMVIGPYVKQGYVSNVEYNHASALKHLGNAFGLEDLNARMAGATDLTDCIDMERLAAGDWAKPIDVPEILVNTDSEGNRISITSEGVDYPWDDSCERQGAALRTMDPISQVADRFPHLFSLAPDLRPAHKEYIASIDRFLRAHRTRG
jgi:phospholipase C